MQFKKARKKGRATCLLFVVLAGVKQDLEADLIMRSSGGFGSGFRIQVFSYRVVERVCPPADCIIFF
jgi:hypothetical protein